MFRKEEKAKLLKTIAKTLECLDDRNTNQMTSAHHLFTQLVSGNFGPNPEISNTKNFSLINEAEDDNENENSGQVLANETIVVDESEEEQPKHCNPHLGLAVVVPETQLTDVFPPTRAISIDPINHRSTVLEKSESSKDALRKEKTLNADEVVIQPLAKKLKYSNMNVLAPQTKTVDIALLNTSQINLENSVGNRERSRSPSVLSEIIEAAGGSLRSSQEDKGTTWKMKPNVLLEKNTSASCSKKLKQMTLSLTRAEKKHDISLSQGFKGGVASRSDDEKDVVLPSPERSSKISFLKKPAPCGTMEDPDMTVFNPAITSTCLPNLQVDTSFDKLPESQKSPTFKYRRDTVRKRDELLKLPGQDCDQCIKYYKAAGLDKTQEIRERLNTCSRHRDKYQIRANTPPGFWDPVLPVTPEGSQEGT